MSAHKSIDKICAVIVAFTLILAVLFCCGEAFGIEAAAHTIGYENRLFDHSRVHSFDIVIDDWDAFLKTCENEEYSPCTVIIDGESHKNVGIRAKGNTSLSSVKNMNSSRYSFKIEFDQYDKTKSYHGLDKLCLNNIIQDNTYMKDYLAYTLMADFGVDAPLCSYANITVNGENWGLYLAVEAIEESFLTRNYGSNYGDLYKPDAMGFGGGRGNGKDFSMSEFMNKDEDAEEGEAEESKSSEEKQNTMPGFGGGQMPNFGDGEMPDFGNMEGFDASKMPGGGGGMGGFGMGSDDVKLKYTDDEFSSYSNIFNNAKTTVTDADKTRLIASLKALLEQSDLENTVDVDEVIRYFVVHDFLVNGDSYTGQMIHNYYLYEKEGKFCMIPWDYNLAYGSFMGSNASSSVNSPIDTPVSNGMSDRPMVSWIFDNEQYTAQYHQLFSEFLGSVNFEKMVTDTAALIDKYVEQDSTKFCTYDEFKKGVDAMKQFCTLRAESVQGQLDGTIPSTSQGQSADKSALIDTGSLNISDMGTMGGFGGGGFGRSKDSKSDANGSTDKSDTSDSKESGSSRDSRGSFGGRSGRESQEGGVNTVPLSFQKTANTKPSGGNMPEGFDPSQMPGGGNMPEGFDPSQMPGGGNMPDGFDPSQMPGGGNMPEGFDPSQFGDGNMPDGFTRPNGSSQKSGDTTQTTAVSGSSGKSGGTSQTGAVSKPDSDSKTTTAVSGSSSRPQMGGFSGMSGQNTDHTVHYILLGVSALILVIGLGVAAKFKR